MRIYEKTLRYVTDPSPPRAAALPVPLSESRRDGSCPCSAIGLRFAFARPCPGERLRRGTAAPGTLVMPGSDRASPAPPKQVFSQFLLIPGGQRH